jgi:flagellar M-ring protein FliF
MAKELQATTADQPPATAARVLPAALDQLRSLGPGRILAIGTVLLAILGFAGFALERALAPRYTLLFGALEASEVAAITEKLDAAEIPWRLNARGDAVLVPADQVASVRMMLAEEGLPAGDVVGYELFDRTGGFASTDFEANVNLKRALEGELARTIKSLAGVRAARVHLVQPARRLFQRESEPATASVFLALDAAARIGRRQVDGIRYLVASAVPGLDPERVTVMTDRGELLARGEADGDAFVLDEAEQYRRSFEESLREKLVRALERTVGPGRVDAQVTADLDFDEKTSTQELFDPTSQVARSSRTTEETTERNEVGTTDTVTAGNNLPGAQAAANNGPTSREQTSRTAETTNFEISRTVQNARRRAPVIRRLFVAIQVDGLRTTAADGSVQFQPRPAEELAQFEALARSIAGIDDERGDRIEVVSRPFVQPETLAMEPSSMVETMLGQHGHLLEAMVWLVALALALLFGLRPLLRRLLPSPTPVLEGRETAVVVGDDGRPLLVHAASGTVVTVDESGKPVVRVPQEKAEPTVQPQLPSVPDESPELVDLRNVHGKVRASLVNDLADIIETHPEDAVRVIRDWLHS